MTRRLLLLPAAALLLGGCAAAPAAHQAVHPAAHTAPAPRAPEAVSGTGAGPSVQVPVPGAVHGGQGAPTRAVPRVAGPEVSAPAHVVVHAPTVAAPTPAAPPPAPAPMVTCGEGEEWQGDLGCVATQRPDEVIGRQETGPNGESCTVTDAQLDVSCAPPPPPAP